MRAQVLLRDQVLAFPRRAVDHRDGVVRGPGPHPPREPPRQAHQVRIVQHRISLGVTAPDQAPPPGPDPARRIPHRVVGIEHNPVHAVIPAGQQARIAGREVISHPPTVERTRTSGQDISRTAPEGGHCFRAKSRTQRRDLGPVRPGTPTGCDRRRGRLPRERILRAGRINARRSQRPVPYH